jgi:hypothetical protein
MLDGIKKYLANRDLKRLRKEMRIKKVLNYHQAKEIGILYHSDNESTFVLVKHFIDYLMTEHGIRNVIALGFVDEKEPPFYHSHVLHHDYFTAKEIGWRGKPNCQAVESFVAKDLDILIDLSRSGVIPLQYILEMSKARFKVGRQLDTASYDMLLEMKDDSTLDHYIHSINHFLRSINHHEERQRV